MHKRELPFAIGQQSRRMLTVFTTHFHAIVIGVLAIVAAFIVFLGRSEVADMLYRYYHSFSDPGWRPKWLPMHFRPTLRQTRIMTWFLIVSGVAFGTAGIVFGLR